MSSLESAYAQALLRAAPAAGVKQIAGELAVVVGAFREQAGWLYDPGVPGSKRASALSELFSGVLQPILVQLLSLMASRGHLRALPGVRLCFDALAAKALGEVKVKLRSPYAIDAETLGQLKGYLSEKGLYSKEMEDRAVFEMVLDKSLIGGFEAECNGRLLDETLSSKIRRASARRR